MTDRGVDPMRLAVVLGLLFGLAGMGSSAGAIAVPLMADDLGVTESVAVWSISLYVLFLAVTTAIYGRVSDLVGIRTPLVAGVLVMGLASVVAALAPNFAVHLVARLAQGAGAAAIPTLGVAVLNRRFTGPERGRALGLLAGVAAAIVCLGPLGAGAIEAVAGWRGILALPVVGALLLPLLWRELPTEGTRARLDFVGAGLVAAAAGGVVLLVQAPSTGLTTALVGTALIVAAGPAAVGWIRSHPEGFLPLAVVRNQTVVRSALAASAIPAVWFALLVAVPTVLIRDGWEPWQIGLILVPSAVLALFVPRFTGALITTRGTTWSLMLAGWLAAACCLLAAWGANARSGVVLAAVILVLTFAFNLGQPALSAAVADAVDDSVRGVALGVGTLVFLTGGSVGSAVIGGIGGAFSVWIALASLTLLPLAGVALLSRLRSADGLAGPLDEVADLGTGEVGQQPTG